MGSNGEDKFKVFQYIIFKAFFSLLCIFLLKTFFIDKFCNVPEKEDNVSSVEDKKNDGKEKENTDNIPDPNKKDSSLNKDTSISFKDAFGKEYTVATDVTLKSNPYNLDKLSFDGERCKYNGKDYKAKTGISVSKFHGKIDWDKVKKDGIDFAFIRIGHRGSTQGAISVDPNFKDNVKGATKAKIPIGGYFFSQALTDDEARNEANFVLRKIKNMKFKYPIVFDMEEPDDSRIKDLSIEERTSKAVKFCKKIRSAGYKTMVYSDMMWEAFKYNMKDLQKNNIDIWYGDYNEKPQTPYDFRMWKYSDGSDVDGIKEKVPLSLWFEL